MLPEGMMIQVSICDPDDKNLFLPTDKAIIYNYKEKYYCTGSFCGFDFTDLSTGIYVGNKIICPTCGSNYNITNGIIEQGPSMRNISSFVTRVRKENVEIIVPDHIPAFILREHLAREDIDPRVYVVIGDSEAALSAILTLRWAYTGQIILFPTTPSGSFQNKDILLRKFGPLSKEEVYYVEPNLLQKAAIDIETDKIEKIDFEKKVLTAGKKEIPFTHLLFAGGCTKETLKNYVNVFNITDYESHAQVHNKVIKAKHVWVVGPTFEAFQLISSIWNYLNSLNFKDVRCTILDNDNKNELVNTLGPEVAARLKEDLKNLGVSVIDNAKISDLLGDHALRRIQFKKVFFK